MEKMIKFWKLGLYKWEGDGEVVNIVNKEVVLQMKIMKFQELGLYNWKWEALYYNPLVVFHFVQHPQYKLVLITTLQVLVIEII